MCGVKCNIQSNNLWFLCRILCVVPILLFAQTSLAKDKFTLKFATLAPPDTSWMKVLDEWGEQVEAQSGGRIDVKMYPGGIMGDEPVVIKKMRARALHAGMFSGYGIGRMYPPARVLEYPFLFQNIAEIDHVRAKLMPEIEQGFRDNGYELLGWTEIGFVHFFSSVPIQSMEDLKKRHIWLWQGDPLGEALMSAANIAPVPLSIMDVYTQLDTGKIDTVYSTPLAALAMQWHTKTKYVTNIPMANGIGAIVVAKRYFDKLPKDLQQLLKRTGKQAGEQLIKVTRADNDNSIQVLKESGLKFLWNWDEVNQQEVYDLRDQAARHLADSGYIPKRHFEQTRAMLDAFRGERINSEAVAGKIEN